MTQGLQKIPRCTLGGSCSTLPSEIIRSWK